MHANGIAKTPQFACLAKYTQVRLRILAAVNVPSSRNLLVPLTYVRQDLIY